MLHRISLPLLVTLVLVAFAVTGCQPAAPAPATNAKDLHDHPETGPHGGHLIELGTSGEYHGELTHDDAAKTVTIYLLGKDAKTSVAITDPDVTINLNNAGELMQVKLPAVRQESDPEGKSSRFSIMDEKLLAALDAEKTSGKLNVNIDGTPYNGPIEHHDHGHEHK